MRIVAGRLRGRRLEAPAGQGVRPTGDRTREAVFNILAHAPWAEDAPPLAGPLVLDAFCGTGALAFEALSRGVAKAVLMDVSSASLAAARRNAQALGEGERCTFLRADASDPPAARAAASLAFLDPPYGRGLVGAALPALAARGWLAPGATVVAELAAADPSPSDDGFQVLDEREYGDTRVAFLRYEGR